MVATSTTPPQTREQLEQKYELMVATLRGLRQRVSQRVAEEKVKRADFSVPLNALENSLLNALPVMEMNAEISIVVLGQSEVGKTHLIKALFGEGFGQSQRTTSPKWTQRDNLRVLDTEGEALNGTSKQKSDAKARIKEKILDHPIDALLICLSARSLNTDLKNIFDYAEQIRKLSRKKHGSEPQILHLITQMDTHRNYTLRRQQSFIDWGNSITDQRDSIRTNIVRQLSSSAGHLVPPAENIHLLSVLDGNEIYGVAALLERIGVSVGGKILDNLMDAFKVWRRNTATKIIAAFVGSNLGIGGIPIAGQVFSHYTTKLMIDFLGCLCGIEQNASAMYEDANAVATTIHTIIRVLTTGAAFALDITILGLVVGVPASGSIAASQTLAIGARAYNYFANIADSR